jgi:hypothetical protein
MGKYDRILIYLVSTDDEKTIIDSIINENLITFHTKVIIVNVLNLGDLNIHFDKYHNMILDL